MSKQKIEDGIQFLDQHGLNLFAVFDCATLPKSIQDGFAADNVPLAQYNRLVLIGNGGGGIWDALRTSTIGQSIDSADPVDDFSKKLTEHFVRNYLPAADSHRSPEKFYTTSPKAEMGQNFSGQAYIFYPGPLSVSLIQLGALANWSHPSPLGLGIHAQYGLWFAYRAAFLTTVELPLYICPEKFRTTSQKDEMGQNFSGERYCEEPSASPCESCVEKPCISACPVGAVSATDRFNIDTCFEHRIEPSSICASQCLARTACPIGVEHTYSREQIAHHYDLSLSIAKTYMQREPSTKNNIVLTGFMGTGKTTVGKLLAAELGYKFVDTDDLIEARLARTIPEIFADLGEAFFRQTESAIAAELARQSGLIISTGGGLMLDPQNVAALSSHAHIFCLAATAEEILARVLEDHTSIPRPLLSVADPGARIVELLNERAAVYGQFAQIETTGRTPNEVTQAILDAIDKC